MDGAKAILREGRRQSFKVRDSNLNRMTTFHFLKYLVRGNDSVLNF